MKFAYDSHIFPQFMIVIWQLETVIQYYLKSNKVVVKLFKLQINYRLNELTCLYKLCGFFPKVKFEIRYIWALQEKIKSF